VGCSSDRERFDNLAGWYVEHSDLPITQSYQAELAIIGNGDCLWSIIESDGAHWFMRGKRRDWIDWRKNIQLVVSQIGYVYLAGDRIIVHAAKRATTEQVRDMRGHQIDSDHCSLSRGDVERGTWRRTDILGTIRYWNASQGMPLLIEDGQGSCANHPEAIREVGSSAKESYR